MPKSNRILRILGEKEILPDLLAGDKVELSGLLTTWVSRLARKSSVKVTGTQRECTVREFRRVVSSRCGNQQPSRIFTIE